MQLFLMFIIGTFASFVLCWSIAVDDSEGPFYIYTGIRKLLRAKGMPDLLRENADCPYCASFWSSALIAVVIQFFTPFVSVMQTAASLFLLTYAMHGVIVFWFRYVKLLYGISAKEY